ATLKQELEEPALLGHVFHFGYIFLSLLTKPSSIRFSQSSVLDLPSKQQSEIALFSVDTSDQTQLCSDSTKVSPYRDVNEEGVVGKEEDQLALDVKGLNYLWIRCCNQAT
ncbi:hypothetical protein IGI04_024402, partial [Brassica rapa subsp. trilocularis]